MTQAKEQQHYEDPRMWSYERHQEPFDRARLIASVETVPGTAATLLDIGAGIGLFLKELEARRPEMRLTGLERSITARQASLCHCPVVRGSAETLPFGDRSFDVASSHAVIEHLPYDIYETSLAEMERVADKYILIEVPDRENRLHALCPYCGCAFNPHYHMRSFDDAALAGLFPAFRIVEKRAVRRRENLVAACARPFRRRVFAGYPEYALCPQCGYRREAGESSAAANGPGRAKRLLKAVAGKLPKISVPGKIIVLYERLRIAP